MRLTAVIGAMVSMMALADPSESSISIDSVVQRWPWNNKLDITYTVSGGQNVAAGVYARIVFAASIGTTNITIDGVHDVGADASDGTHAVTWTLPSGLRANACTMTASLFSADIPSGDDYMVIDLDSGAITYEGLLATQAASNDRYNTATYKTDKLVLRKVPAGGPYQTGDTTHFPSGRQANTIKTWTTEYNYYIGVFPVTQYQYAKIGADSGSTPSVNTGDTTGTNIKEYRPVENVSWEDLRLTDTASTSPIPAVDSQTGTFFQRLNHLAGLYFDLPTEVMLEIAARAGSTDIFYWGDAMDLRYVVCSDNDDGTTVAVGSRLPNNWGLYDAAGNVWEWCLDDYVAGNLTLRTGVFIPARDAEATNRRCRCGGTWAHPSSRDSFYASYRNENPINHRIYMGFRVAMIAK